VYDEEAEEEDIVLSVSPKSLSKVKEGNTITLKVSSFEDTIVVEDYTGKNLETIKASLESSGIRVVTTAKKVTKDDNIAENTIVSQSVEVDERLQKDNGVIELVYATLITVYPDFTDGTYTIDLIQQFCDDNGITCEFNPEEDNNYNEGDIILQSRGVGDEVKPGTKIKITYATKVKESNEKTEEVEGN
jgi:beta-lactam-binding protein with PASTA domain